MCLEIMEILKSIPSIVWSGVVGALLALAGVVISNASSNKRLDMQLAHDSKEKAKDKLSSLRKEVYLKAVEDITLTNIHISTIASRDLTSLDLKTELHIISASMEKLKIVADLDTEKVAQELGQAYGALIMSLLPKLVPLQEALTEIDINNSAYNNSSADASRATREMQKFNEEARQDIDAFRALERSYKWHSEQAQKYCEARTLAYVKRNAKSLEFNASLLPEMKELSRIQLRLMASIRKELGMEVDIADMQRRLERTWAVMEAGYSDVIKGIQPK